MGKQGPCHHCGVTSTPLWRNGPPDKPVLCNACGSRWRTKGTLTNYIPLHARSDPDGFDEYKISRVKTISIKNKEKKMLKRKQNYDSAFMRAPTSDYNQGSWKNIDEDTSNRSSSGSAISNSESCVHFGSTDVSELTGPAQSIVWETMIPSKKRTCVTRPNPEPSPVEKLTKDLFNILHEQQASYFSGSSEEDLLFGSDTTMVSVEIGHGSMLIRHPSSITREDESEASSLSVDNKLHPPSEVYSQLSSVAGHNDKKGINFPSSGIGKINKAWGEGMEQLQLKRDKTQHETIQILGNHDSPLCYIDMQDVMNYDEFMNHLTNDEQQQLLKYLPPIDADTSDSLKSMFNCPQFKENLSSFQKLLAEGVFDLSLSDVKTEECRTLKRLALCRSLKSEWVEHYSLLKDINKSSVSRSTVAENNGLASGHSINVKISRDGHYQNSSATKVTMKSPKRVVTASYKLKEENDGSCFSPNSLFALPSDGSSLMLDSFHFADKCSNQDLILNVPSNSSFPQAELLLPPSSFTAQASTSSSSVYPNFGHP